MSFPLENPAAGLPRVRGGDTPCHELQVLDDLPTATGVAVGLLLRLQREDLTPPQMVDMLSCDPALACRLLQRANAGRAADAPPVTGLSEGVARVGPECVRRLVLDLPVVAVKRGGGCAAFDYARFWSESLARAIALELLCARTGWKRPEEGYTLGLLARVGQLALATVYPDRYAEVLEACPGMPPSRLLGGERAAFLIDHLELAASMFDDWGLPKTLSAALPGLLNPAAVDAGPAAPATRLAGLLHLADGVAGVCAGAPGGRDPAVQDLLRRAEALGLPAEQFRPLLDDALWQWRSRAEGLGVTPRSPRADDDEHSLAEDDARTPVPGAEAPLRVLVVDDDAGTRLLVSEVLRAAGHDVASAADGREGLRMALEHDAQLVVSDWLMPELDGIELCRALRGHRGGRRMYIILVTGQDDDQSLVQAFEAGADDYVAKPVRPHLLAARLRASERLIRLQRDVDHEQRENRRHLSELAVANRRLEQAALSDPLTGLPNRRYATRRLQQIWAAARRENSTIACMLIDIDHFKRLNDTYGHQYGDAALCEVAEVLRKAARRDDEVCRIGGEEFLVVCSNSDVRAAAATAERLRAAVEAHRSSFQGIDSRLTISLGVAVCHAADAEPDDLLRVADDAVYAAKRDGRNRVCSVGEPALHPAAAAPRKAPEPARGMEADAPS